MAAEMGRAGHVSAICLERRDRVRLGLLLCLLALWPVVTARAVLAQGPANPNEVGIQQMRVQVMPEFDDPRVLVIVQGRVEAAGVEFPVRITFRLPKAAQINQMATVNMESAGTTRAEYESEIDAGDGRWQLVTYELEGAHFFYEYYWDPIVGSEEKAFSYVMKSYHAVGDLSVEIQQPKTAEEFVTEPEAAGRRLDESLRLYYYEIPLGALSAGREASVEVRYTKTDPAPSLTWEQVMALQEGKRPPEAAAAPEAASKPAIPMEVVVFVGGALLIVVGAFIGYRLRLGDGGAVEVEAERNCRMCGTGLKAEARYCHRCGGMVLEHVETSKGRLKPEGGRVASGGK